MTKATSRWSILTALALAGTAGAARAETPGKPTRDAHCRARATVLDLAPRPAGDWYGLYLGDKKVGWLHSASAVEQRGGRPVRLHREEMLIEVLVGERKVRRQVEEERVYEPGAKGKLLGLRTTFAGDGGDRSLRVDCGATTCRAEFAAAGSKRTVELPHPGETVEQAEGARLAALRCGTVVGPQLQSDDLRVKRQVARYVGRDRAGAGGVTVPVSAVEELEEGDRVASRALVGDDGRMLEGRVGDGMVIRLEPAETARRLDLVDLFATVRVALPRPLPRDVPMSITYAFRGLPRGFDLADARQRTAPGSDGETLVTVTARPFTGKDVPRGLPAPKGDVDQAATLEIDWEDPALRKVAADAVGSETGTWAAARRISRLVHDRLAKVYGQSQDRASEILREGKGDCTEHTRLFVALCRAAGIRAREVKGLVFAEYGQGGPALYWHAWPEVKVGDAWVAMDPTFGQEVADATHVALGRGTRTDAIALVGALKVVRVQTARP